jgi:hypothetical protein
LVVLLMTGAMHRLAWWPAMQVVGISGSTTLMGK